MDRTPPKPLVAFIARRPGTALQRVRSEASRRSFYRLRRGRGTLVAMVYPEPSPLEVERFLAMQKIYRRRGLRVPRVDQVLGDQVVLQEDLGDLRLQKAWRAAGGAERRRLLGRCREMLGLLADTPPELTPARLDPARQRWEMDFFLAHFFPRFPVAGVAEAGLRAGLHGLVAAILPGGAFAHRDFHSRNLLVLGRELALVDFQDSLVAPRYYDLVSLAFDSYLDLGAARALLFPNLAALGEDEGLRQVRLTALQRNIKALGTFGYQAYERRHPAYARYIPRTVRHIRSHLRLLACPEFDILTKYFFSI